jgi:hypothetical protein
LGAERGAIARERVARAIGQELQRQVSRQFVRAIRENTEPLLPEFKAFGVEVTSRDLSGQNSTLENLIVTEARRLESAGLKGAELERAAYTAALKEYGTAHLQLFEQHVLASESDSDSKAIISALRNAFNSANIDLILGQFLADQLHLPPARRRIDLDGEDLSRVIP